MGDGVGVVGVVDRRAGFGGWIGWVDRWVDRFETVDLLISGWIIGSSGDDFFEWVCSGGFRIGWVSNRRCGFGSVVGVVAVVGFGLMVCVWVTVGSLFFFFFFFFLAMTGA